MEKLSETQLYAPVKIWLEALGYEVKAEVGAADVLACRAGADPIIVELKTTFSLTLLQQAVARQAITDQVYVAVPRWKGKTGWRTFKGNVGLCKRLGVGVLSVQISDGTVQAHTDPSEFRPRKSRTKRAALMKEFQAREGDPNAGGTRGQVMTSYKQDALRCVTYLAAHGPCKAAVVAKGAGVSRARQIMADNHSGWFEKVARGIYGLSAAGAIVTPDAGD